MEMNIAQVIFSLVSVTLTGIIIPYIKLKLSTEQLHNMMLWAEIGVRAVEQMPEFKNKSGYDKKQYVLDFLSKKGLSLSMDDLDTIIESAVKVAKSY